LSRLFPSDNDFLCKIGSLIEATFGEISVKGLSRIGLFGVDPLGETTE
jgi:hypothetical protein